MTTIEKIEKLIPDEAPIFYSAKEAIEWVLNHGPMKAAKKLLKDDHNYEEFERKRHYREYIVPPTLEEMPLEPFKPSGPKTQYTVRTDKDGDPVFYSLKTGKKIAYGIMNGINNNQSGQHSGGRAKRTKKYGQVLILKDGEKIDGVITQRAIQDNLVKPALARLGKLIESQDEFIAQKSIDTVLKYAGIPKQSTVTHEAGSSLVDLLRTSADVYETRMKKINQYVEDAIEVPYRTDPRYKEDDGEAVS